MPNYEYQCQSCGHQAEIFQKMADDPLDTCPECGKPTFERLISQSSFALKGDGWYADGYGGKPGSSKPSSPPKPNVDAKSESKSESKSETKSEPKKESAAKKSD